MRVFLIANNMGMSPRQVEAINAKFDPEPEDVVVRFNGKKCPSWSVFPGKITHIMWRANADGFWGIDEEGKGYPTIPHAESVHYIAVAGNKGRSKHAELIEKMKLNYGRLEIIDPMHDDNLKMSLSTGAMAWKLMRKWYPDARVYCIGFTFICHDGKGERDMISTDAMTTVVN